MGRVLSIPDPTGASMQSRMRPNSRCGAGQQDGDEQNAPRVAAPCRHPRGFWSWKPFPPSAAASVESPGCINSSQQQSAAIAINIKALPRAQAPPMHLLRVWVQRIYSWTVQSWVETRSWLRDLRWEIRLSARAVMGKAQLPAGAAGLQRSTSELQLHLALGARCFPVNFSKG